MKHFLENDAMYFRFISSFARTVDESFSDESVAFVVSLDQHFIDRIAREAPDNQGVISFSFRELVGLTSFKPQQLLELIRIRLKDRKWPKSLNDFISVDAFWAFVTATGGHPRRSLAVLRAAMEYVERNKEPKKIDAECVKEALIRRGESLNEKDIAIVKFLATSGPHSASDEVFQEAVNLTRKPLSERLKNLTVQLDLETIEQPSGRTTKTLYSLAKIQFGP